MNFQVQHIGVHSAAHRAHSDLQLNLPGDLAERRRGAQHQTPSCVRLTRGKENSTANFQGED